MSQENIGKLADTAYWVENHEQASDDYSKILDVAPENTTAFLRKRICGGWLSEPDPLRFEEAHVCIDEVREPGGGIDEEELSEQGGERSENFLADLYGDIDDTLCESEKSRWDPES